MMYTYVFVYRTACFLRARRSTFMAVFEGNGRLDAARTADKSTHTLACTTVRCFSDERSLFDLSAHRIDRPVSWSIEGRSNHMRHVPAHSRLVSSPTPTHRRRQMVSPVFGSADPSLTKGVDLDEVFSGAKSPWL